MAAVYLIIPALNEAKSLPHVFEAIEDAGLLDRDGVAAVFGLHEAPDTTPATQTQLDAVINHMLGVQILYRQFVAADVPPT